MQQWTTFLVGCGSLGEAQSTFDANVKEATKRYQRANSMPADGVVGNGTMGQAMRDGYPALDEGEEVPTAETSAAWPERPADIAPLSLADRQRLFGTFGYVSAPVAGNPEAIRMTDNWASSNITTIVVPQLSRVAGAGASGRISVHKLVAPQILSFFLDVEQQGLLPLVRTFGGAWAPRFIRGSKTYLSNHAWGTAVDLNVPWNGLGTRGTLVGEQGSVRKLVPIALEHGLYWGGWFQSRPDPMHFEAFTVLSP